MLEERGAAGGASTLTAARNQDLAQAWRTITAALTERNLAFGALYHRWLENDPLEAEAEFGAGATYAATGPVSFGGFEAPSNLLGLQSVFTGAAGPSNFGA